MASRPARLMATAARELCGAAVLTAVTCALASCSASSPAPRPRAAPREPGRPGPSPRRPWRPADEQAWVLTKAALAQVVTDPAILAGLERSRVLEILHLRPETARGGGRSAAGHVLVGRRTGAGGVRGASCPRGRG